MKQISFLIKPASSACNLRCRYCFYKDVADNRTDYSYGVMSKETAHALIDRAFEHEASQITFCFQGGEPTCAGIDYFRDFTSYAEERKGKKKVSYAIQTNATLLDEEWIALLKKYGFLVGVSLDGFIENHDAVRPDANQQGTFERILKAVERLEEEKVEYNILTVLTQQLAQKPDRLFNFYRKNKFRYIQLIPCLPSLEGDSYMDSFALKPRTFASFYKKFFDRWHEEYRKGNYMSVTLFDNVIPMYRGIAPNQCGMLGRCQVQMVVEGDGSVYPCDFYVLDEYCCGNIRENSVEEILNSEGARKFMSYQRTGCKDCETCPFVRICHGNCRRLSACYYDEKYCGYREFLTYSYERMIAIARSLR